MKHIILFVILSSALYMHQANAQNYRSSDPEVSMETMHSINIKVEKMRTGGFRVTPKMEHYQSTKEENEGAERIFDFDKLNGKAFHCDKLDHGCLAPEHEVSVPK